jgi:hypothetical protein
MRIAARLSVSWALTWARDNILWAALMALLSLAAGYFGYEVAAWDAAPWYVKLILGIWFAFVAAAVVAGVYYVTRLLMVNGHEGAPTPALLPPGVISDSPMFSPLHEVAGNTVQLTLKTLAPSGQQEIDRCEVQTPSRRIERIGAFIEGTAVIGLTTPAATYIATEKGVHHVTWRLIVNGTQIYLAHDKFVIR